jgi:hypothetical protein
MRLEATVVLLLLRWSAVVIGFITQPKLAGYRTTATERTSPDAYRHAYMPVDVVEDAKKMTSTRLFANIV